MAAVPEVRIVDEIPDAVKKLASLISRSFYGFEHGLIVDLLKRNVVMKESHIQDLTKFDSKQLRSVLIALKQDKIIKERQRSEEGLNGRSIKINYYFINYRAVINVTKYKIDHMRKKLETEELTNTHRASYRCSKCNTPFSDLEIDRLMDFTTGLMMCFHCRGEVIEDATSGPSETTRSSLALFNEQMIPFFGLLQELDGVQLAPHLLEPALPDVNYTDEKNNEKGHSSGLPFGSHFGGNRGAKHFELYKQQDMDVRIEDSGGAPAAVEDQKQLPVWLQNDTIPGALNPELENSVAVTGLAGDVKMEVVDPSEQDELVARTLRAHEKPFASPPHSEIKTEHKTSPGPHDERKSTGGESSEDELEEVAEEVFVQGTAYALADIISQPGLVNQMTAEEKEAYIEISQRAMDGLL